MAAGILGIFGIRGYPHTFSGWLKYSKPCESSTFLVLDLSKAESGYSPKNLIIFRLYLSSSNDTTYLASKAQTPYSTILPHRDLKKDFMLIDLVRRNAAHHFPNES
jgi:hypothetical protein